ncbi:threonine--tRNA ligase [Patescibacteria group bacterium]|nr:threonine--tRNA ligase [Patescibacteria group bacterium]MBU1922001.1 threonine--tRNA ligase [Patescibacteria group bacterium]
MSNQEKLNIMRHSAAHVMAAAVLKLFPDAKFGIGPTIEDGFYYDFELPRNLSPEDLPKIEQAMSEIVKNKEKFAGQELGIDQAVKLFKDLKQDYKVELLNDLKQKGTTEVKEEGQELFEKPDKVSIYKLGDFVDLCRGPHLRHAGEVKVFKLTSIAGAYWRGDEKNPMLQRIYGTAWENQKELDAYLKNREEATKRDHRKLGKELEIFMFNENIGKGLPLLLPNGRVLREEILKLETEIENRVGYERVWTPHIAKSDLYKLTGHWEHYRECMFSPFGVDDETYVLRPMTCPHHYMIYKNKSRSWRDLPLRIAEDGTCYRYEKSGELGGLARVRCLTIDDAHIFVTPDQVKDEYRLLIKMVQQMFEAFKLKDYYVSLSTHDPKDKKKYIADEATWNKAEKSLEEILKENKIKYELCPGEAAFYGPKLDFIVHDVLGREWQMSTLQIDFFMAERLGLTYVDKKGNPAHPIIVHRGFTGSLERTIAMLIEHFAGAFPVWLSPTQIKIISVGADHIEHCRELAREFMDIGARVQVDDMNETVGNKIRKAEKERVPYMLVIGDKEIGGKELSIRERGVKKTYKIKKQEFIDKILKQIKERS